MPYASGVRDIATAIGEDSLNVFPLDASVPARRARKTQVDKRELWAVVPRSVKGRRMMICHTRCFIPTVGGVGSSLIPPRDRA